MIQGFKHKGLERFFTTGSSRGILVQQSARIRIVLGRLNASASPRDMNLPGLYLYQLRGKRKGAWAVRVSGNWRITFRVRGPDVYDVDLEDYH